MANIAIFRPFSFLAPQQWTSFQAQLTPTSIRISQDVRVQTFGGDFAYYTDGSVEGSVNSVELSVSGALTYRMTGLSGSAFTVQQAILVSDGTQLLYAHLLMYGDTLSASGAAGSVLCGYGGDDRFIVDSARYALIGGSGRDTADYTAAASAVTIDIAARTASDTGGPGSVYEIEHLIGSRHADRLSGSADANRLDGGDGADTLDGSGGNDTLFGGTSTDYLAGGEGDDFYLIDSIGDVVIELADGGSDHVEASANHTLADGVERLTLTGSGDLHGLGNALANRLEGNVGANRLAGGAGADTLVGGAGADTLVGGIGNDEYILDMDMDTVIEVANAGFDTLVLSAMQIAEGEVFSLVASIEGLRVVGDRAVALSGNAANNVIESGADNDSLDGGAGRDTMIGGAGDDLYFVDNAGDRCVESLSTTGGADRVQSAVSYTLSAAMEHLVLIGDADLDGIGNSSANRIVGNAGSNRLTSRGGADTLVGGAGDDTYVMTSGFDLDRSTLTELAGGGTDTVMILGQGANVPIDQAYRLPRHFENLTIAGSAAGDGVGNAATNVLRGNAGRNRLDGSGGADTMIGGKGHDDYFVDHVGDIVIESTGSGTDSVVSSVSYALSAEVERLFLIGDAPASATGNALANYMTGNGSANRLDGGGGADTMAGGAGDDTYVLSRSGDAVWEDEGGGLNDTIIAPFSFALTYRPTIEHLTLSGRANADAIGNDAANRLTGNGGANLLDGARGSDTMRGGAGNDEYVVDTANDVVIEGANGGIDHVTAAAHFTLGGGVEHLSLIGAYAGVGNALDNRIECYSSGGVGANLEGRGGNDTLVGSLDHPFSADRLVGGTGNDSYAVFAQSAVIIELAGEGHDTVTADCSYTLSAQVEDLLLVGDRAIEAIGNASANRITANGLANLLDGGSGADTLVGGLGNDTYVVNRADDVIIELAGQDLDSVISAANWTLTANTENLRLTGNARIAGHGNETDNLIEGNDAANLLDGRGGIDTVSYAHAPAGVLVDLVAGVASGGGGADTLRNFEDVIGSAHADRLVGDAGSNRLTGGSGADQFVLNSSLASDTITDCYWPLDVVQISQSGIRVGNGDQVIDGSINLFFGDSFSSDAELVAFLEPSLFSGLPTAADAAAALGNATEAYETGDRAIFVINFPLNAVVFLFESSAADASIGADELTQLAVLANGHYTAVEDFAWIA